MSQRKLIERQITLTDLNEYPFLTEKGLSVDDLCKFDEETGEPVLEDPEAGASADDEFIGGHPTTKPKP